MSKIRNVIFFFAVLMTGNTTQATLMDRGGGLIYDSELNITWLQDANAARTLFLKSLGAQGDSDGMMNWDQANAFAANFSYFDSVRGLSYSDWRLPMANDLGPQIGCNFSLSSFRQIEDCGELPLASAGEIAHLWTETSVVGPTGRIQFLPPRAYFLNVQPGNYWYGTPYFADVAGDPFPTNEAWCFFTATIVQHSCQLSSEAFVFLVRPGDVGVVPLPATRSLIGIGLLGLIGVMRRKAHRAA